MDEKRPLLRMENISKSFPGVKALSGVNLKVFSGEVIALLGENGAGKSTLMKILSGVYKKDDGKIYMDGNEVEITGIKAAKELGISIIHQELSLLQNLTVWENIFLGEEIYNKFTHSLNKREMIRRSRQLLDEIGCKIDPEELVKNLTVGEMQMVEIVKAVSSKAKVIIMDEPTTALTDVETEMLFKVIRKLKAENIGMVYISHRLDEIFEICERITVIRDGSFVGEAFVKNVDKDTLISMMVGRKLEEQYPHVEVKRGETVLSVKNLNMGDKVKNVSFEAYSGEILGIAGLMGSGRTEVAKTLFGEYKKSSGEILIHGRKVDISSPRDAVKNGIAYLSEDRKKEGLVLNLPIGQNMSISNLKKYENGMFKISKRKEHDEFNSYVRKIAIKTTGYEQIAKNLSGGNQQKVILAKWIMLSPEILIIDEPTRGIDVGAKKEIYEILNELKAAGKVIIVISSEMQEILGVSDRIIVMHEGKITGELQRKDANQESVMKYAVGLDG